MPDFRNFKCDNCGACCSHLIIEASYVDAMREPKLYQIASPNLDHEKFRDGSHCIMLYEPERKCCPFLNGENKCDIYATRPHCCVAVEPGDAKCQQAREMAGLEILKDMDGNPPTVEVITESADEYEMDFIPYYGEGD